MTNLLGNFCLTVISFGRVISFQGGSGGIIVLISHLASFLIRVVSFQRAAPLAVNILLGAAAAAAATAPTTAGVAASTVLTTIRAAAATAAQATRIAAGIASR